MFKQSRQKGREHRSKKGEIDYEELRKAAQEGQSVNQGNDLKSSQSNRFWRH